MPQGKDQAEAQAGQDWKCSSGDQRASGQRGTWRWPRRGAGVEGAVVASFLAVAEAVGSGRPLWFIRLRLGGPECPVLEGAGLGDPVPRQPPSGRSPPLLQHRARHTVGVHSVSPGRLWPLHRRRGSLPLGRSPTGTPRALSPPSRRLVLGLLNLHLKDAQSPARLGCGEAPTPLSCDGVLRSGLWLKASVENTSTAAKADAVSLHPHRARGACQGIFVLSPALSYGLARWPGPPAS